MNRALSWTALLIGGLAAVTGIVFIVLYSLEAFIYRIGEPDQSLLFWYLPILFLGIIALIFGTRSARWGLKHLRSSPD
ncbi:hypothetical protein [Candidatus Reidiella endopervernicosa]|uniref:Uncharacterized protein n=1 Tax=Candidatus Reidiella endopervernicosa TaxID=2738883 RepID=A0A6N0HSU0_9GAMM|nr:hypothetical protein [Candidatus Reidiella endopervernicosa]QKQ25489.1 hypothetical protein HUE57_03630 [Candidatus Reidiella endopervernicosa]